MESRARAGVGIARCGADARHGWGFNSHVRPAADPERRKVLRLLRVRYAPRPARRRGVTEDFRSFKVLSLSVPDNRNTVLFPEKIAGNYARLERPMPVYSRG